MVGRGSVSEEKVTSIRGLSGTCDLPGNAEISTMALAVASVAEGVSVIRRCSVDPSVLAFEDALREIGIRSARDGETVEVTGGPIEADDGVIVPVGQSVQFSCLAGLLAGAPFRTQFRAAQDSGVEAESTIDALKTLGASVSLPVGGMFPLKLGGRNLVSGSFAIETPATAVKCAMFLAARGVDGSVTLTQATAGEDDLEVLFRRAGRRIDKSCTKTGAGHCLGISGPFQVESTDHELPGDAGAALFTILSAAVLARSDVTVQHVGVDLKSRRMMDLIRRMNVSFELKRTQTASKFHTRQIQIKGSDLRSVKIAGAYSQLFMDELPFLAVVGASSPGETIIREAAHLREGETDCISILVENLRNMQIQVGEMPDGLVIKGGRLQGATVDAKGDARIGLAFILGGLVAEGETVVLNPGPVRELFPGVLERIDDLEKV